MWNTLDEGLKNQPTISYFKNNLQITTFPKLHVPNYFTSGNRYLSVIHARIRNNCSNLNNDLFINHLRDNPLCNWCNEIEDSEHYFFHCNNYRNERHLFFEAARDFQPLTTQLLLYGNEIVDNTLNSTLFRAVHDYIKSTKHFVNTQTYFFLFDLEIKVYLSHFLLYPIFSMSEGQACSLELVDPITG